MADVAAAIAAEGVRPGIWMRSLLYREPPADGPIQPWEGGYALDPSHSGINSLAFRLAQHRAFFAIDSDCVASTHATDWSLNRQFLDLVARSGTSLFVSVDPTTRTDAVDNDLSGALRLALDGGVPGGVEPLDWLETTTPQTWRTGATTTSYSWFETTGADPYARNDAGEFID
jgi:hypothetical protein